MRVLTWSIPDSLDPTHAYYVDTMSILSSLVTRSLTQYVWNPDSRSMMLIPDIATDLDTSNADFTEWTFTIRDGVRFEDDAEVTAEDVAFGIKRSFDRDAFKSGATYSNDYFLNGDTYKGPYRSGTDYPGVVVSAALPLRKRRQPCFLRRTCRRRGDRADQHAPDRETGRSMGSTRQEDHDRSLPRHGRLVRRYGHAARLKYRRHERRRVRRDAHLEGLAHPSMTPALGT